MNHTRILAPPSSWTDYCRLLWVTVRVFRQSSYRWCLQSARKSGERRPPPSSIDPACRSTSIFRLNCAWSNGPQSHDLSGAALERPNNWCICATRRTCPWSNSQSDWCDPNWIFHCKYRYCYCSQHHRTWSWSSEVRSHVVDRLVSECHSPNSSNPVACRSTYRRALNDSDPFPGRKATRPNLRWWTKSVWILDWKKQTKQIVYHLYSVEYHRKTVLYWYIPCYRNLVCRPHKSSVRQREPVILVLFLCVWKRNGLWLVEISW